MDDPDPDLFLLLNVPFYTDPAVLAGLFGIVLLLILSGLIAAMEVGFFALGPVQIESLRNDQGAASRKIIQLLDKPKNLIATIVLSHNLVNIGVVLVSESLSDVLFEFPDNPALGFFVKVVVVTFFIVLVGEVIPKIYSGINPLSVARALVMPLDWLQRVFRPINYLLISGSAFLEKRIGKGSQTLSIEDLSQALELTSNQHSEEEERKILEGIVEFGNTEVKEVMKPRLDVVAFDASLAYDELLELIRKYGFSRVPVYKENLDQITGILVVKDLLPYLNEGKNFPWQKLTRPTYFVPENQKIDEVLAEFQKRKNHLAVVVDEYGGTSGIITLEDILEEILGEINDEFDDDELNYSRLDDSTFVFEGKIALNDLYRILRIDGDEFEENRGDADTLAGFILELCGKIPARNEKIEFGRFVFTIESADTRKINRVKLHIARQAEIQQTL